MEVYRGPSVPFCLTKRSRIRENCAKATGSWWPGSGSSVPPVGTWALEGRGAVCHGQRRDLDCKPWERKVCTAPGPVV
jgi:hypothetical protein